MKVVLILLLGLACLGLDDIQPLFVPEIEQFNTDFYHTSPSTVKNKVLADAKKNNKNPKKAIPSDSNNYYDLYSGKIKKSDLDFATSKEGQDPIFRRLYYQYKNFFKKKLLDSADLPHTDEAQNSISQEMLTRLNSPMNYKYDQYFDRKSEEDTLPGKNLERIIHKKKKISVIKARKLIENSNKFFTRMLMDRDDEIKDLRDEVKRLREKSKLHADSSSVEKFKPKEEERSLVGESEGQISRDSMAKLIDSLQNGFLKV